MDEITNLKHFTHDVAYAMARTADTSQAVFEALVAMRRAIEALRANSDMQAAELAELRAELERRTGDL